MATCAAFALSLCAAGPAAADDVLRATQIRLSKALTANAGSVASEALSFAMTPDAEPARLSRNALLISNIARGPAIPHGWLSIHGKGYDGGAKGHAVTLMFGTDVKLGRRTRGGVAVLTTTASVGFEGVATSARTTAIGPYYRRALGKAAELSAWALFGRPAYKLAGQRVRGLRWNSSVALSAQRTSDRAHLSGRIRLTGWGETDRGAMDASALTVSAHAEGRATFRPEKPLTPYLGVWSDLIFRNDSLHPVAQSTRTRISAGMSYARARTRIAVDLGTGPVEEDRRTATLKVNYGWRF